MPQQTLTTQAQEEEDAFFQSTQQVSSNSTLQPSPFRNDSDTAGSLHSATLHLRCLNPMTTVIAASSNNIGSSSELEGEKVINFASENNGGTSHKSNSDLEPVFTHKVESYPSLYADNQPLKLVKMGNTPELLSLSTNKFEQQQFYTQTNEINSVCTTIPSTKTVSIVSGIDQQNSFCQLESSNSPILYTTTATGRDDANVSAKNSFLVSSNALQTVQTTCYTIPNGVRAFTVSDNLPQTTNGLVFRDTKLCNGALKVSTNFACSDNKQVTENEPKSKKSDCSAFVCPVCQQNFKSKRSFNSHILVHCQVRVSFSILESG